jgi:hypothetical protein
VPRRKAASLEEKRRNLRLAVKGRFEAARAAREAYTDMGLATAIADESWDKARPVARLLVIETIAEWLAQMARAATETTRRADQPDIPGVILYRDGGSGERKRKSVRAATLAELRSYAAILSVNAAGALAELRKVQAMITLAERSGCGEDDEVWPFVSDEPSLPLEGGAEAPPASGSDAEPPAP